MSETTASCHFTPLAKIGHCEILMCPHCREIHLRVGPLSVNMPPYVFRSVREAVNQAVRTLNAETGSTLAETLSPNNPPSRFDRH